MGDIVRKLLSNSFVLFVIFIVIAIIIPLPSWLLDFMILLNISLSLIILVMTMFIKEALEFSVFPTVLLLTTVLRLSLNVSTTRGILSSGYAGEVISAFGNFVMGGDAIVGFLIFIIIVLVNFIVITKGSERVSEVAARFTLDAMPGKQMAIDADLNAGIINEEQAKKRRSNIQREADFYGSMDGATKFVKATPSCPSSPPSLTSSAALSSVWCAAAVISTLFSTPTRWLPSATASARRSPRCSSPLLLV